MVFIVFNHYSGIWSSFFQKFGYQLISSLHLSSCEFDRKKLLTKNNLIKILKQTLEDDQQKFKNHKELSNTSWNLFKWKLLISFCDGPNISNNLILLIAMLNQK